MDNVFQLDILDSKPEEEKPKIWLQDLSSRLGMA